MSRIMRLSGPDSTPVKLDLKDKNIMAVLVDDARMSITQLAKKVGLKRETVDYRIKKLIEQKFITGFAPIINFKLLGYTFFEVFLLFNEANVEKKNTIIKEMAQLPYTKSVIEYSDCWDIKLTVIARNLDEFDMICDDIQKEFGYCILERERAALLKSYAELSISELFQPGIKLFKERQQKNSDIKIDKKDLLLLKYLSEDCRQSTYAIGNKVGLSPDGVTLRIKKLFQIGIIEKFATWFDNSRYPIYWYTLAAKLKQFDYSTESKLNALIKGSPKIKSARKTFGNWDILFSVVASSHKEIQDSIRQIKYTLSGSMTNSQTWLASKEQYFTAFPEIIIKK